MLDPRARSDLLLGIKTAVMARPSMELSFKVLSMPGLELKNFLEEQILLNPLIDLEQEEPSDEEPEILVEEEVEKELDFSDSDFSHIEELFDMLPEMEEESAKVPDLEKIVPTSLKPITLLKESIEKHPWESLEEKKCAEEIALSLEETGFLEEPLEEIAHRINVPLSLVEDVRKKIILLEPLGSACLNLKEFLLLQLLQTGEGASTAARVIELCFEELLKKEFSFISKKLDLSPEVIEKVVLEDVFTLSFTPFVYKEASLPLFIDMEVANEEGVLRVVLKEEELPQLSMNPLYERWLAHGLKSKKIVQRFAHSFLWLQWIIEERKKILLKVAEAIVEKQKDFFIDCEGTLEPWTQRELAEKLNFSEATISRALQNKWLICDRGAYPLNFFFPSSVGGEKRLSSQEIKNLIEKMISQENKRKPLSDQEIALELRNLEIECSRRTITKYRQALDIPATFERKKRI